VPDAAPIRLLVVAGASLLLRVVSAAFVTQPGYTDAYYYVDVAARFARGLGLTADFVWSPLEYGVLPVVSHRFWMPLATVIQAAGIAPLSGALGDFRAAQAAIIVVATFVPVVTYLCARRLGAGERAALAAAAIVGVGGLFAPAWVTLDGFAIAALLGTLFFLAYARAAEGSMRAGAMAGLLVGLLYLTRAEAALFGLALLALVRTPASRRAGVAGSLLALAIGGAWLARDLSVGPSTGFITRTALLVRYEDFFSLRNIDANIFTAPGADVLGQRIGAVVTNAGTFVFSLGVILVVPLVFGIRALWPRVDVRAWTWLAAGIFAVECLVFTLHSTRGSYFHSLGAFFPFGVAIAVAGGERMLATRSPGIVSAWTSGVVLLFAALSIGSLLQWSAVFVGAANVRAAAVDAIPAGTFLAIDAAAWRWIAGRSVLVTPSDGLDAAACFVAMNGATSIVLEEAHFSAYDALYRGGTRPAWLGTPIERGTVKIFPVISGPPVLCAVAL
jgi:hypothetical protein